MCDVKMESWVMGCNAHTLRSETTLVDGDDKLKNWNDDHKGTFVFELRGQGAESTDLSEFRTPMFTLWSRVARTPFVMLHIRIHLTAHVPETFVYAVVQESCTAKNDMRLGQMHWHTRQSVLKLQT